MVDFFVVMLVFGGGSVRICDSLTWHKTWYVNKLGPWKKSTKTVPSVQSQFILILLQEQNLEKQQTNQQTPTRNQTGQKKTHSPQPNPPPKKKTQ